MASKLLTTYPIEDGFTMPAEFTPQKAVWIVLASKNETWYNGGFPARKAQRDLVRAINEAGTHVNIGVPHRMFILAEELFEGMDVTLYECTTDDCWIRDYGAIFVKNSETQEIRGVDFKYTAYGSEMHGASMRYFEDDLTPRKMLQLCSYDRYSTKFVFEGGSITTDGEGTVITTESCLLNKNRNPDLSREEIEETLHKYLGFEKVIWLPEGVDTEDGETDGHVDDVCAFIAPGEVVTCYTEDQENEYYEVFKKCYEVLCEAVDAKGRKLIVHKIPAAAPFQFTKEEAENMIAEQGVGKNEDGTWREEGDLAVPSYANFLITNGSIIFPIYNLETDDEAVARMREIVGDRYVIRPVIMHDIALGGGSIHCITMQEPL